MYYISCSNPRFVAWLLIYATILKRLQAAGIFIGIESGLLLVPVRNRWDYICRSISVLRSVLLDKGKYGKTASFAGVLSSYISIFVEGDGSFFIESYLRMPLFLFFAFSHFVSKLPVYREVYMEPVTGTIFQTREKIDRLRCPETKVNPTTFTRKRLPRATD